MLKTIVVSQFLQTDKKLIAVENFSTEKLSKVWVYETF